MKSDSIAKRKIEKDKRYVELNERQAASGGNPLEQELYGELYSALEALDETEREILKLYYWLGYTFKEISKILGVTYEAVRQKHLRLKKKLKKYLTERGIKL